MTNEEILKKAIEKAVENGFDKGKFNTPCSIFSHDFAKAFWGKRNETRQCSDCMLAKTTQPNWQFHLQQMVLEEEPIKYLAKFL